MVVLGIAMVYGIRFEFQPRTASKPASKSTSGQASTSPSVGGPMAISAFSNVLVFAYAGSAEGFVQTSVTIAGPLVNGTAMENQTLISNGTSYYVDSFNGTTTADLQNPLILQLFPAGVYTLSATYGSAPPQNLTLNVTGFGVIYQAVFNFGSSPMPPMGHLLVETWATTNGTNGTFYSSIVQASVAIIGPESFNATLLSSENPFSIFTVATGAYTITATYASFPQQTDTANVTDGGVAGAYFFFGGPPPP